MIWLAPRAGKMKRILCSDWLPERARWAYLVRSGFPALLPKKAKFFGLILWPFNKPLLTKSVPTRWRDISLVLFFNELDQYPAILTEQAWSISHI